MRTEKLSPEMMEPTAAPAQPELLVSAVLHLMSHYTAHTSEPKSCVKLASVIERHLKALANQPGLAPVLRATCQQLSEQWEGIVENAMPRNDKPTFFSRIAKAI